MNVSQPIEAASAPASLLSALGRGDLGRKRLLNLCWVEGAGKAKVEVIGDTVILMWHVCDCGHTGVDIDCDVNVYAALRCPHNRVVRLHAAKFEGRKEKPTRSSWTCWGQAMAHGKEQSGPAWRTECIEQWRKEALARMEKKAKDAAGPDEPAKVGNIFVCDWGYEQTNIDFYQVTSVTSSGRSVGVVRLGKTTVRTETATDWVVPMSVRGHETVVERRVKRGWDGKAAVRISDARGTARLWDGAPVAQTAAGYGH